MTSVPNVRVQDIGEQGLLKRLQAFCPAEVVGDDAAVLLVRPGRSLVVTADLLVDGVHFSDRTTSPEDAGWRAAAANLSDLAAMGAMPLGITVSLGLPGTVAVDWVERLYQGMVECLQAYGTVIVGGDICRSPVITVAITAFGDAHPNQLIRRSTAQPGDAIVVTGVHGASRAGLELLLHPEAAIALPPEAKASLIRAHQRPIPRLDVIQLLWSDLPEALPLHASPSSPTPPHSPTLPPSHPPTSHITGMDSSDGLADAVIQICRASGVGARIDRHRIPMPPALNLWLEPEQRLTWALYGGEDFELVLCLAPIVAEALVQVLGGEAAIVGTITDGSAVWLVDATGRYPDQPLNLESGFQHFGGDR